MSHEWFQNMDNERLTGVVFLDIRKPFDSINYSILLFIYLSMYLLQHRNTTYNTITYTTYNTITYTT